MAFEKYDVICIEDIIDALAPSNNENEDELVEMESGEKVCRSVVFDGVENSMNPFNSDARLKISIQ